MKKVIFLFLIGFITACNNNVKISEINYIFYPSFSNPTKFTIDIKNKTIQQYTFQNVYEEQKTDSNTIKNNLKDTLIVHYKKKFNLKENVFTTFLNKIKQIQLDSTIKHSKTTLDGIGYQINKISSKRDTISLTSNIRSRSEKSKLEYQLLDAFFELTNTTIDIPEGNYIIEDIQKYFQYKPIIKKLNVKIEKISESPIEYKIWGELNGCKDENKELATFLNKLPEKTPILFDITKGDFSDCLNKELLMKFKAKKEFYFYGSKEIKWVEEEIENITNDLKNSVKGSSENSNDIDSLLGSNAISEEERLKNFINRKKQLNKKNIFLNKNEIIKLLLLKVN